MPLNSLINNVKGSCSICINILIVCRANTDMRCLRAMFSTWMDVSKFAISAAAIYLSLQSDKFQLHSMVLLCRKKKIIQKCIDTDDNGKL
jgi:hypothetical protein